MSFGAYPATAWDLDGTVRNTLRESTDWGHDVTLCMRRMLVYDRNIKVVMRAAVSVLPFFVMRAQHLPREHMFEKHYY
jgi:hypothetical protein